MQLTQTAGAAIGISGTLEYRDAAGNIIGATQLVGSIPLADIGLSESEAQQIIHQQEGAKNGTDVRE